MKRRIGDRRNKPRFEIVGDLWGTIDVSSPLTVRNLGRGGALLESAVPLVPESVHAVVAVADGQPVPLQMRVRHSTPSDSTAGRRYLLGVEFLNVSPALDEFILRHVGVGGGSLSVERSA
jgi:hypothetical protein